MAFSVRVRCLKEGPLFNKLMVCKVIKLPDTKWEHAIRDQISIISMNKGTSIINYYDSFSDGEKVSIVLEKMDGDFLSIA